MNIFVGSLPFKTGEAELKAFFEAYGLVESVKIITDRATGRSKGFGFVEMPNEEEGQRAVDELNGSSFGGRNIVVNKSEPRPANDRRSFNDNRGSYRSNNERGGYERRNNY